MEETAVGRLIMRIHGLSRHGLLVGASLATLMAAVGIATTRPGEAVLTVFGSAMLVGLFIAPRVTIAGIAVFLLLQPALVNVAGGQTTPLGVAIQRLDEVAFLGAAARIIVFASWRLLPVPLGRWLWLVALFVAFGVLSSFLNDVPLWTTMLGAFLASKFAIAFLVALTIPWAARDASRVVRMALVLAPVFLVVGALLLTLPAEAVHMFADSAAESEGFFVRGYARSMQGPFIHPGMFGWAMAVVGSYAFATILVRRGWAHSGALLCAVIGIVASLRRKPLIAFPIAVLVGGFPSLSRRQRMLLVVLLLLLSGGTVFFGRDRLRAIMEDTVSGYLDRYSPTTARTLLYQTGWQIAVAKVPLGAGFGRFGGYVSQIHYSPVYDEYALSSIYGLSRESSAYIQDTYWPHILGETGFAGAVVIGLLFIRLWRFSSRAAASVTDPAVRIVALAATITLVEAVLESLVAPIFENSLTAFVIAVPLGMVVALAGTVSQLPSSDPSPSEPVRAPNTR